MSTVYQACCTQCGHALWAARSIASGLCSACHPDGANLRPDWDALDPEQYKARP